MAVITTTIVPTPKLFGYSTLSGARLAQSNAPRGEVVFGETAAIATVGGSDTQFVTVEMNLPDNFSYVLIDMFCAIAANDAEDWDDVCMGILNMAPPSAGDALVSWIPMDASPFHQLGASLRIKAYKVPALPKGLLVPQDPFVSLSLNIANLVTGGLAATVRFWCRFVQYDVNQHHDVSVNLPTLTR